MRGPESVIQALYDGILGLSCVTCLQTFRAIVSHPSVAEGFKVYILMKLDFHQKLLLGVIAIPDHFKFLFWVLLPLPDYIQVIKFVLHVRY